MNPIAWLLAILPAAWKPMLAMGTAAIIAAAVLYGIHEVLDAKADAERAKAETYLAEQKAKRAQDDFNTYREFAHKSMEAMQRVSETQKATIAKLKRLRDQSHASTDDGPLPNNVVRFLIGLRPIPAGIIAPDNPDPPGS